jgi:hypothetical protein
MKRLTGLTLIALVAAVVFLVARGPASAQQETKKENPFQGSVVTVYLDGPNLEHGQILENAEIKEIGGRKMLVGVGANSGQDGDWTAGLSVGIAWDQVAIYYLESQEQFKKKLEKEGSRL